jgi:hypothetical protein
MAVTKVTTVHRKSVVTLITLGMMVTLVIKVVINTCMSSYKFLLILSDLTKLDYSKQNIAELPRILFHED